MATRGHELNDCLVRNWKLLRRKIYPCATNFKVVVLQSDRITSVGVGVELKCHVSISTGDSTQQWEKDEVATLEFSCTAVRVMAFLGAFACHLAVFRLELLLPSVRGGT